MKQPRIPGGGVGDCICLRAGRIGTTKGRWHVMTPQKPPSRTRLLIAATMVTLAATCITASTAPAATTPSGLNQTVSVYHSSGDANASTQVGISTFLYKTSGGT